MLEQLIAIRQQQAAIYEEQLVFEMRILHQFLPQDFDQLERFISPISHVSLSTEQASVQLKNQRLGIIREAKRKCLHLFLSTYEIRLHEYNMQYKELLQRLESVSSHPTASTRDETTVLSNINQYMSSRTSQLKQEVCKKMPAFREKLLRNRQRSSSAKGMIGVSPEPYLDLLWNPFTAAEWQHLTLGRSHFSR